MKHIELRQDAMWLFWIILDFLINTYGARYEIIQMSSNLFLYIYILTVTSNSNAERIKPEKMSCQNNQSMVKYFKFGKLASQPFIYWASYSMYQYFS